MSKQLDPVEQARVSLSFIESSIGVRKIPRIGIVAGSGFGALKDILEDTVTLPYSEIPEFPVGSVEGHAGMLCIGTVATTSIDIALLLGRVHGYEGFSPTEVVHAVRTLALGGIDVMMLTNAAGCLRMKGSLSPGHPMIVTDHINFTGTSPFVGQCYREFGNRFPDMQGVYHPELVEVLDMVLALGNIPHGKGVYGCVMGPCFETPAESRWLRSCGADAVGMSTVWEAEALHAMGVSVCAISGLANPAAGLGRASEPIRHADVTACMETIARNVGRALIEYGLPAINEFLDDDLT